MDESTQFAGHIHHVIKLGLSVDDDDESLGDDNELPPVEGSEESRERDNEDGGSQWMSIQDERMRSFQPAATSDCNIQKESLLHLVLHSRGGMPIFMKTWDW